MINYFLKTFNFAMSERVDGVWKLPIEALENPIRHEFSCSLGRNYIPVDCDCYWCQVILQPGGQAILHPNGKNNWFSIPYVLAICDESGDEEITPNIIEQSFLPLIYKNPPDDIQKFFNIAMGLALAYKEFHYGNENKPKSLCPCVWSHIYQQH